MKALDASQAVVDVLHERSRQKTHENFSPEHDDKHASGELAGAAACYVLADLRTEVDAKLGGEIDAIMQRLFPWSPDWWKPKSRRRNLVRAAALLVAEIERLDRRDGEPVNPISQLSDSDLVAELGRRGFRGNLEKLEPVEIQEGPPAPPCPPRPVRRDGFGDIPTGCICPKCGKVHTC